MTMYNTYDNTPDEAQQLLQATPFLPENDKEITRRKLFQRHFNELPWGILPPALDLSQVHRVLDVYCGAGEWIFELAQRHLSMEIIGIDHRAYFIEHGKTSMRNAENVTFHLHNMYHPDQPLFAPESFDLIHIQFLSTLLTPRAFPPLLHSLARLCRPGGFIVWSEAEIPLTNSPACEQMTEMMLKGLKKVGQTFSPGYSLGITAHMQHWIVNAGYRVSQDHTHVIDVSAHTDIHKAFCWQASMFCRQVQPFLLKTGVTTTTTFEEIYAQTRREIQEEAFCGLYFLRNIVGVKDS